MPRNNGAFTQYRPIIILERIHGGFKYACIHRIKCYCIVGPGCWRYAAKRATVELAVNNRKYHKVYGYVRYMFFIKNTI